MRTFLNAHPGLTSILLNGSWQSSGLIYDFAIRLVYLLVLSRLLGPAEYGFFVYAQSYYMLFLPLVLLGIDVIIPREIGKDRGNAPAIAQQTFSLRLCLGITFCAVAILIACLSADDASQRLILIIMSLALIPRAFRNWCSAVFLGFERMAIDTRFTLIFRTLEVALGCAALYQFGAGLLSLAGIHLGVWLCYAAFTCRYIHRHFVPIHFSLNLPQAKAFLAENIQLPVNMFLSNTLKNGMLVLARHVQTDAATYGQFAILFQGVLMIAGMFGAFTSAAMPVLACSLQRADGNDKRFAFFGSALFFAIGALIALCISLWGADVIMLIVGKDYTINAQLAHTSAMWLPFFMAISPLVQWLFIRQKLVVNIMIQIGGILCFSISLFLLWPISLQYINVMYAATLALYLTMLIGYIYRNRMRHP